MSSTLTFLGHAERVLLQREADGIRGIKRERSRFKCHIEGAAFAPKPIDQIVRGDIAEWLREMSVKPANDTRGTRTISTATIKRSQALVSAILADVVEREIIASNPCLGVKLKKRDNVAATKEKWAYLTPDEQRAIVNCAAIPEHERLMIEFAFRTGLRQAEQYYLKLEDLIVEGDRPRVIVRYSTDGLCTKSRKIREVPLLPDALVVAKRWLELLPTFCPDNPHGLVWPNAHGRHRLQGKPLGRSGTLKHHLRLAGIARPIRWHDLRHSFATSLASGWWGRRWTAQEIQKVMGHSSITITEKYMHVADSVIHDAARETVIANDIVVPPAPISSHPSFAKRVKRRIARIVDALRRAS